MKLFPWRRNNASLDPNAKGVHKWVNDQAEHLENMPRMQSDRAQIPLFWAGKVPMFGMFSAIDPMALGPGQWPLIKNMRLGTGLPRVRGGTAELGTILANGTFRGFWMGTLNGAYTIVVGVKVGSETLVYKSTDGFATKTEITAGSGKYGNTRFTDNGQLLTFERVWNPLAFASGDLLVMQNGTDNPRVYSVAGAITTTHESIAAPSVTQEFPVKYSLPFNFPVNVTAEITPANTGSAAFVASNGGTTPNSFLNIAIGTGTLINDTATFTLSSTKQFFTETSRMQWILGIDTEYGEFLDKVKIEAKLAGALVATIHDPTSTVSAAPVQVPLTTGLNLYVFDKGERAGSLSFDRVVFTWVAPTNEAPSIARVVKIFMVAGSGRNPGQTTWGTSYYNSSSFGESPGVAYTHHVGELVSNTGGPADNKATLPNNENIYYEYALPYKNTSTADRDKGVDSLNIYRKRPQDDRLSYYTAQVLATYAGSWSYFSTATDPLFTFPSGLESSYDIPLPSGFHLPLPVAKAMKYANGRLFAGAPSGGNHNLMFSGYKQPFRFRRFTREEDGPGAIGIQGETVQAFAAVATSTLGVDTIYAFTDQGLYALSGFFASQLSQQARISDSGTLSPYSVQTIKNTVFWLDKEMQVRRMRFGSIEDLSRDTVDDLTRGIPGDRRAFAYGCCNNERYLLAFTPSGATTNTRILVWEDRQGKWTLDTPPKPADGLVNWFDGTGNKFRLVLAGLNTTTLMSYEYDDPATSQDLGTNIAFQLDTYEVSLDNGFDKKFFVRRVGFLMDKQSAGSATITRTYKPHGGTGVATMLMTSSNNQIWRWDGEQTIAALGNGASCQISIAGTAVAGTEFYRIIAEAQERGYGADR